ncbi:MAG: TolC family protein [Prosthecobacter sp.]|nr:TolC family protein [Prosthecobacter sp.]
MSPKSNAPMSIHRSSFLFFACASSAWAATISVSVEGAASYALRQNQNLAAARFWIEEARGRLQQSGRLSNPELEMNFTRNTVGPEGSAGIAFMQRFPVTGRLRHEKAVSRAQLAAAEAEVSDAERKLAAEVRIAAVRLLSVAGQRELRTRQLANSRELAGFLLKRVATAEASQVDVRQVELESRQIEVENLMLVADEAVLLGELRPLMGVAGADRIAIKGELPAPEHIPAVSEVMDRADILAAESRAEAARSVVLEQRARRWEDFGFGLSYTRDRTVDEPEAVETEQILGFRFSMPLPIWNNNSGRIREARAAAGRAAKEVDATRLAANAEVIAAIGAMRAYRELISEIDANVLPAAAFIEEQLRTNYSTGQSPLTDVLRARTRRLDLQRQRLDALREYHLARIRHAAATTRRSHLSTKTFK